MVPSLFTLAFRKLSCDDVWNIHLCMELPLESCCKSKDFFERYKGGPTSTQRNISPRERYLEICSQRQVSDVSELIYDDIIMFRETIYRGVEIKKYSKDFLPALYNILPFTWRACSLDNLCLVFECNFGELLESVKFREYCNIQHNTFLDGYNPWHYLMAKYYDPTYDLSDRDKEKIGELQILFYPARIENYPLTVKVAQLFIAKGVDPNTIFNKHPEYANYSMSLYALAFGCHHKWISENIPMERIADKKRDLYLCALEGYHYHHDVEKFYGMVTILSLNSGDMDIISSYSRGVPVDILDYVFFQTAVSHGVFFYHYIYLCLKNNYGYLNTIKYCLGILSLEKESYRKKLQWDIIGEEKLYPKTIALIKEWLKD